MSVSFLVWGVSIGQPIWRSLYQHRHNRHCELLLRVTARRRRTFRSPFVLDDCCSAALLPWFLASIGIWSAAPVLVPSPRHRYTRHNGFRVTFGTGLSRCRSLGSIPGDCRRASWLCCPFPLDIGASLVGRVCSVASSVAWAFESLGCLWSWTSPCNLFRPIVFGSIWVGYRIRDRFRRG
jgi:hypothetical protein